VDFPAAPAPKAESALADGYQPRFTDLHALTELSRKPVPSAVPAESLNKRSSRSENSDYDKAPGDLGLPRPDFCIETDGEPWTLCWHEDRVSVEAGNHGTARVRLTSEQLSDIVNDQSTPVAFMSTRQLDMPEGGLPEFLNWWLVLRSALDGRKIHARGDVKFNTDIRRSFPQDDSDEEMRAFLEQAGYLHLEGFFSEEEMAAVQPGLDLEPIDLPTRTGDVTVHPSCTHHTSISQQPGYLGD
jgi:hypothetical protein